ncbi:6-phosphofructokinase [Clostridium sp. NSJ-6]|uniref:Pyrophosphate--fructose 6-phosphate 1-phosphotransferase n=1 Tax=Clostridium hominis TaxID=2763036 RepID=A0ABR7DDZ6_9CLOT|nr:6-phosphofructokinase [Clostridium hominis]MBC5629639.1 6-phosphofructokinase [Clostridium hominis]
MKGNMLIAHGGGPTAVINASLYGAIEEAKKYDEIGAIYGAIGGSSGILEENFINFRDESQEEINLLPKTPASALGTSRFPLYEKEYARMLEVFKKYDIKYVLFNGGNGSMDTCGKIYEVAKESGINVIGIPKTIDNDISITDHSPGFGSAARYMATSVKEVGEDVKSLPIHVSIIEAMGRNAGWITASSALARKKEGDAPHLIYLPERPFVKEEFLADVKRLHEKYGGVVVVASEGLKDENGNPIVEPIFKTERATYFGDVGTHLATLVIKELGIKARSEKPGILGRASITMQSEVDVNEAIEAGRAAVKAAVEGKTGYMVGLNRISTEPYKCETSLIPINEVMMYEKALPKEFINERGNYVTEGFIDWCKPLIGRGIQEFTDFNLGARKEKI